MTDHSQAGREVPVQRRDLFRVPIWTVATAPDTWWIPRLVDDITGILATRPQDPMTCSGHQTLAELQDRTEEHWLAFLSFARSAFAAIAVTAPQQRYRKYHVRSWALRVNAASAAKDLAYGPTRTLARHNHSPALLTSVFACELPRHPEPTKLATIFHNPAAHLNCPWQSPIAPVPPAVGMLLVFPGWLEHSVPITAPVPEGEQRITINTDYFPEF